jgi:hypothetical protein
VRELELLEEKQSRSIFLHLKYLHALDGVLEDKKEFYAMQRADQQRLIEEQRMPDALDVLMNRPGFHAAAASTNSVTLSDGIAAEGSTASESWHGRHHHQANYSVSGSHSPLRAGEVERLHNPYSIYAPPTPKYNKKK